MVERLAFYVGARELAQLYTLINAIRLDHVMLGRVVSSRIVSSIRLD